MCHPLNYVLNLAQPSEGRQAGSFARGNESVLCGRLGTSAKTTASRRGRHPILCAFVLKTLLVRKGMTFDMIECEHILSIEYVSLKLANVMGSMSKSDVVLEV